MVAVGDGGGEKRSQFLVLGPSMAGDAVNLKAGHTEQAQNGLPGTTQCVAPDTSGLHGVRMGLEAARRGEIGREEQIFCAKIIVSHAMDMNKHITS